MKRTRTHLCLAIVLGTNSYSAFSAGLNAVIGLNSSQIIEAASSLSFAPNQGTYLPLKEDFSPISHGQTSAYSNWLSEIDKKVTVEHKQRDLHYTGKLSKIDQDNRSFSLTINNRLTAFPIDDFYLIPLDDETYSAPIESNYRVSYQTNQLSWSPQLNILFDGDSVSLSQQALIHNHSGSRIQLQNSMLHYASRQPTHSFKAERSLMAMSSDQSIDYQDNEITYALNASPLALAPYSTTLIPLPSSKTSVSQQIHTAAIQDYGNMRGATELNFYNQIHFTLPQDGLPGEYKTFQQRDGLLIPGNTIQLDNVRSGVEVKVAANKSRDVRGTLTLLSATSHTLPSTQVWQAKIENHANQEQDYSIQHSVNGVIEKIESDEARQQDARSLVLNGRLDGKAQKVITYTVILNK